MSLPLEISVVEVKARLETDAKIVLIDVREPHEHRITRIEGAELIPMNTIPQLLDDLETTAEAGVLVVFCHHGVRSLNVVSWLRGQGLDSCQSMSGGIEAWSRQIDPSIARY